MNVSADIMIRIAGAVGHITLSRPDVLNALTHKMISAIESALLEWKDDSNVNFVMIDAEGDRAFCAGGDVVELYAQGNSGDFANGIQFWREEYRLNALMANYSKPIVAVMDGIVMGGGVGISAHCSHRIATEKTKLALPECSIGLVPDVGSTDLLARAPGHLGEYLALAGHRMSGADALYCGFADYFIASASLVEFKKRLLDSGQLGEINNLDEPHLESYLEGRQEEISTIFKLQTIDEIMSALIDTNREWANDAARKIEQSSPISINVALELVRSARREPGVENAVKREFGFVSRAMKHGDFLEGIRAIIVDKDKSPRWRYASIEDVPTSLVGKLLSPADCGELEL